MPPVPRGADSPLSVSHPYGWLRYLLSDAHNECQGDLAGEESARTWAGWEGGTEAPKLYLRRR